MFASNLEHLLAECWADSEVSPVSFADTQERFRALRRCAKLPRGRENRDQHRRNAEIAAAIFGFVPSNPKWAGHSAIILGDLRPVGGAAASFCGAINLAAAIDTLLTDDEARTQLVSLTLSLAESGTNSNGFATLLYQQDGVHRIASFVPRMAVSLLQSGAERAFDSSRFQASVSQCTVLTRDFFHRVAQAIARSHLFSEAPKRDGSEYDAEEA